MFIEPFTETLMSHKWGGGGPLHFNKLIGKTPLYNTTLLESVCKWDIQLCSDITAPLHLSSWVLFCILSIFKRVWRRFKTGTIFQSIMLCLCPLPNDVSNLSTFSWKDLQRSANGESVSSFKAVEFCHFHPRWPVSYSLALQHSLQTARNMSENQRIKATKNWEWNKG